MDRVQLSLESKISLKTSSRVCRTRRKKELSRSSIYLTLGLTTGKTKTSPRQARSRNSLIWWARRLPAPQRQPIWVARKTPTPTLKTSFEALAPKTETQFLRGKSFHKTRWVGRCWKRKTNRRQETLTPIRSLDTSTRFLEAVFTWTKTQRLGRWTTLTKEVSTRSKSAWVKSLSRWLPTCPTSTTAWASLAQVLTSSRS